MPAVRERDCCAVLARRNRCNCQSSPPTAHAHRAQNHWELELAGGENQAMVDDEFAETASIGCRSDAAGTTVLFGAPQNTTRLMTSTIRAGEIQPLRLESGSSTGS